MPITVTTTWVALVTSTTHVSGPSGVPSDRPPTVVTTVHGATVEDVVPSIIAPLPVPELTIALAREQRAEIMARQRAERIEWQRRVRAKVSQATLDHLIDPGSDSD
jgi:hypothetical protein